MEGYHRSVLLREVIKALDVQDDYWYLDCTLGDGGHSLEILKQGGKVVGLDVDPQALERTEVRLGGLGNVVLIQGNFRDLKDLLKQQTDTDSLKFAGAIFDLGVSSLQFEDPNRGFSFLRQGQLDMRMDPSLQVKALDLINVLSRKELYELFHNLGEEKYSKRLAAACSSTREVVPIRTTTELAELMVRAVGGLREKIHPATRVFQALRIAVNDELNALKAGLDQVKDLVYGYICVISFHSLEDRIVKTVFKEWEGKGVGQIVTRKPIVPSDEEIYENPRSRSAKMRVFKKI
ncbi:16S rRNA (cytosine(1402)-N(4))-methyltransferase RsmH [Candidatus Daviesbacteria bacterium]|nr:16S rRNA (cytosine(1402)-N(4))-methyltransferase RsmH [Candidatus Daviesbacteria bacterium]